MSYFMPYFDKTLPEAQRTQGIESITCVISKAKNPEIWLQS